MIASALLTLTMLSLGFAAPPPSICTTNVDINGPNAIHAGCTIKLQFCIPSPILNTVSSLHVKLYQAGSHRGVVVHQVNSVDLQSQQGGIEILFPITTRFIGNDTLIVTDTLNSGKIKRPAGCPSVYAVHKVKVLPSSSDVMCII
ncbi:hypothetical protein K7432_009737 [Basidiobolus ranarum]|uniref:Uncharacterized protein n=1 Tax=Basidiobolus ranarum TaxID=34480 RepID=A0ABR2VWQ5_9FUNG